MKQPFLLLCLTASMTLLVQTTAVGKPYVTGNGIMPTNASKADMNGVYNDFKKFITSDGCKSDELRMTNNSNVTYAEGQGFALIAAAMMEDKATFAKLWNFTKRRKTILGVIPNEMHPWPKDVPRSGPGDGIIDAAIGIDLAASLWPDDPADYDWEAQRFIKDFKTSQFDDEYRMMGDNMNYYLNYISFAAFKRFELRTGDTEWTTRILPANYRLFRWSYDNLKLPGWYVDKEGVTQKPNDEWKSSADRFDNGPARVAYRLPFAFLAHGDQSSKKLGTWMAEFFKGEAESRGSVTNLPTCFKPSDGSRCGNSDDKKSLMIGGAAVCFMVAGHDTPSAYQSLLDDAYNFVKSDSKHDYMNQAVRMMTMGIMTGQWRMDQEDIGKYPPKIAAMTPANASIIEAMDIPVEITVERGHAAVQKVEVFQIGENGNESMLKSFTSAPYSWTWQNAPRGVKRLKLIATDVDGRTCDPFKSTLLLGPWYEVRPYNKPAPSLGNSKVTIEAEHFDLGGEGIGYHDMDEQNTVGQFRTSEGVDVKDPQGGTNYFLAFTNPGPEWTEYTVYAEGSGVWTCTIHAASGLTKPVKPMYLAVFVDDEEKGRADFTANGDWWTSKPVVIRDIPIEMGYRRIRIYNNGGINIDKFDMEVQGSVGTVAKTATGTRPFTVLHQDNALVIPASGDLQSVTLFDTFGRTMQRKTLSGNAATLTIGTEGFHAGNYYLSLQYANGSRSVKRVLVK